jgi:hypothetical protein
MGLVSFQKSSRRFCTVYNSVKSDPLQLSDDVIYVWTPNCSKHHQPSRRRDIPSGRLIVQSIICPDDENFSSGPSSVSRSFDLFQPIRPDVSAAHPDDTQCSTNYGIFFQNTDMGRSLQPSGRCGFRSNAFTHKASCAFYIQTFGRQPSWFGRASYFYGNCVHLINRPDDHSIGPNAQSLDMEIACS